VGTTGCADGWSWDSWKAKERPPEPSALRAPITDPILMNTIGAVSLMSSADSQRLRGFGLVVGLGDQGSSDCPTSVREYLVDYFNKQYATAQGPNRMSASPESMIDSPDTAVVELIGNIPAGSLVGKRFDVQVSALDAQTRSLVGGVLLPCDLKVFQATPRGVMTGRALASASGAVFTNPFTDAGSPRGETRRGYVLGGGSTKEGRTARLLLETPSYSMSRRIEQRINERFGQRPRVAEAISSGYVEVTTPSEYVDEQAHFLSLVTHLYLDGTPAGLERRLSQLPEYIEPSNERLEHISLIWEAAGRLATPEVQAYYQDADPAIRYYAARAGLRLDDAAALPVLAAIASEAGHAHQILAVREIGRSRLNGAADALARLLDADDSQIRVAAYEELVGRRHPLIRSERFAHSADPALLNFTLDLVRSTGAPLIYVRRTAEPRIAVFGATMPVATPLFYNHPDDWITLDTPDGSGEITVLSRGRHGGEFQRPFHVPARVADVIRALAGRPDPRDGSASHGLGLPYALVVQVLDALNRDRVIAANVVMEERSITELFGPPTRTERREGDAPPEPSAPEASDDRPEGDDVSQ
jgi:hypothetical protein